MEGPVYMRTHDLINVVIPKACYNELKMILPRPL
jgi:hypothetical protein